MGEGGVSSNMMDRIFNAASHHDAEKARVLAPRRAPYVPLENLLGPTY
jgi:hypothetical protein